MAPKVAKTTTPKTPINPEKKIIDQLGKVFYRMFLQRHSEISTLLTDNEIKVPEIDGYEHLDDYYAAKDRAKESRRKTKDEKPKDEKPKEKRKPLRKLITMQADFKYRLYMLLKDVCNELKTYLTDKNCPNLKSIKTYEEFTTAIKKVINEGYTSTIFGIHMINVKATLFKFKETDSEFTKYLKPIIKSYNNNFNDAIVDGLIEDVVFFYNYLSYSFASTNVVSMKNKATTSTLISVLTSYDLILGQRFMDMTQVYKIFTAELPEYLQSKRGKKAPAKAKPDDKSIANKDNKGKDEVKENEDSDSESYESEEEDEPEDDE